MDLKEQDLLGAEGAGHWYYRAKGAALRALLGSVRVPELLDVGAGSGIFARQLLEAGVADGAVCVDPHYPAEYDEQHAGRPLRFRRAIAETPQRLILMIDVLEHVADDAALLGRYVARAAPGTMVMISVPAFQCLWSGHDEFLGHHRRYTRSQLERLARATGLEVVRARYFFGLLLPLVALLRIGERSRGAAPRSALRRAPPLVNAALTGLHALERRALLPINRLAGLSVLCLARRP